MPTLILTPRFTPDAQALWQAAIRKGWKIERLTTWRVPPELRSAEEPVLYLEGLFGPSLAGEFGQRLEEPPSDWLPRLPFEYRKREVRISTLGEARTLDEPRFVKPPNDKSFPARVYRGVELPTEFPPETTVLQSEVVEWEKEFRCFLLNRNVVTLSVYLRDQELQRDAGFRSDDSEIMEVHQFANTLLSDARVEAPRTGALDVGRIRGRGWAVVELNSAWGAGLYGCDSEKVLEVLRHAAEPA